ncbi:MAG: hypothetical protein HYY50_03140 [Candidatus Kerfeldbacteria bacterium]|nr:hypothetical protein [Candidatus Kerfeldbacteria bacterium]
MARSSVDRQRTLLVLNAGSSSVKFLVRQDSQNIIRGEIEGVDSRPRLHLTERGQTVVSTVVARSVPTAIDRIVRLLEQRRLRPTIAAHRVVHGGELLYLPTKLSASIVRRLQRLVPLAPLHLPANLAGVAAVTKHWPGIRQWAVFDTGLYHHLAPAVRLYALPLNLAKRFHIRKYGFHGISHGDAFTRAGQRLHRAPSRTNAVTLHLGSGDSLTAWRAGRPIDTSMGFTPLEGLTMSTRSGDLDPSIPLYLQTRAHMSPRQVTRLLEERSGLFGLTGLRDVRDVLAAAGHPIPAWPRRRWSRSQRQHARLALAMYLYDIERYLASYLGLLPAPKIMVFTGPVGQNTWIQRQVIKAVPIARGWPVVTIRADEEAAIAETVERVID